LPQSSMAWCISDPRQTADGSEPRHAAIAPRRVNGDPGAKRRRFSAHQGAPGHGSGHANCPGRTMEAAVRNWRSKPSFITMQRLDTKMLRRLGGDVVAAAMPAPTPVPAVTPARARALPVPAMPVRRGPAPNPRWIAMRGAAMLLAGIVGGVALGRFVIASGLVGPVPVVPTATATSAIAPATPVAAPPASEPAAASVAPGPPLPVAPLAPLAPLAEEKPSRPHRRHK